MSLPEIRTARLLLRPWNRGDIDTLHEFFTEPEVRRYLWDNTVIPRETVEEAVESHLETSGRDGIGYWTIETASDRHAGFCGIRFIDGGPEIELMYGLRGRHWGNGFATEACRAVIEYLWNSTRFDAVHARTDPPNSASVEVMKRLGMEHAASTDSMIGYLLRRP